LDRCTERKQTRGMRVRVPYRLWMPALLMTMGAVAAMGLAQEQTRPHDEARLTVVVRAERPLQESEWAALMDALQRSLEAVDGRVDVMRGEDVRAGMEVDRTAVVLLHGDCTLRPGPRVMVSGALGWVPRRHGWIEPFIHVECSRIAQMLAPRAMAMRPAERDTVMAAAVARVVEHEWVHIATQSAMHSERGVMQGRFTVMDLMEEAEALHAAEGSLIAHGK
jgi:hypothetical protein